MIEDLFAVPDPKVKALIDRSKNLPDGDEKIALLEEAVRLADLTGNVKVQYDARDEFIEAAYFGGKPEKALVAYVWCLAQHDRHPNRFWEWKLLWRYKWMVNVITDFPQIPKDKIEEMLEDMERRFLAAGYGLRPVYIYRYRWEMLRGNKEQAFKHYDRAQLCPRDDMSDCQACEVDEGMVMRIRHGEDERALVAAEPLLDGRFKCRTVPQRTYAKLLMPLLRLGKREEAWRYHQMGYQMIKQSQSFLYILCDHLTFLPLYGDLKGAARLVENHYHWTEKNTNTHDRFLFYRAAWLFLKLACEAGTEVLNLRMPRAFPLYDESNVYETVKLKDWFGGRARELAKRFDARNGTDYFQSRLLDIAALKKFQVE